jgi:hypothetical protein
MYGREVGGGVAADEITGLFFPSDRVPDLAIHARINDLPQTPALLFGLLIDPEARFTTASETFISVHLDAFQFICVHFRPEVIPLAFQPDSESGHDLVIRYRFSERSDFDNPPPEGLLNEKNRKK